MWLVIDSLYGQNIACEKEASTTVVVSQLYPIEQRLLEWKHALPASLTILASPTLLAGVDQSTAIGGLGQVRPLSTILTLRYLNLRLLLHRPILVKFFEYQNDVTTHEEEAILLQQIGTNSISRCHRAATEIISIVHSATGTPAMRELLGAWWFTLYYSMTCCSLTFMPVHTAWYKVLADELSPKAFNAALISFGCYFVSRPRPDVITPSVSIGLQEASDTLGQAIEALTLLDQGNRMVGRCRHYLQTLSTVLNASGKGTFTQAS